MKQIVYIPSTNHNSTEPNYRYLTETKNVVTGTRSFHLPYSYMLSFTKTEDAKTYSDIATCKTSRGIVFKTNSQGSMSINEWFFGERESTAFKLLDMNTRVAYSLAEFSKTNLLIINSIEITRVEGIYIINLKGKFILIDVLN